MLTGEERSTRNNSMYVVSKIRSKQGPLRHLQDNCSEAGKICDRCFKNNAGHYRISLALSKRRVAAATPEPVASSQTNVREQSREVYLNGNIITFYRV